MTPLPVCLSGKPYEPAPYFPPVCSPSPQPQPVSPSKGKKEKGGKGAPTPDPPPVQVSLSSLIGWYEVGGGGGGLETGSSSSAQRKCKDCNDQLLCPSSAAQTKGKDCNDQLLLFFLAFFLLFFSVSCQSLHRHRYRSVLIIKFCFLPGCTEVWCMYDRSQIFVPCHVLQRV